MTNWEPVKGVPKFCFLSLPSMCSYFSPDHSSYSSVVSGIATHVLLLRLLSVPAQELLTISSIKQDPLGSSVNLCKPQNLGLKIYHPWKGVVYSLVATEVQTPTNTTDQKETPIPTEKQGWKNTESFWSMMREDTNERLCHSHRDSANALSVSLKLIF